MLTTGLIVLGLLGLLVAVRWAIARHFDAQIAAEVSAVLALPATQQASVELPPLLASFLERTGLADVGGRRSFRIEQTGEMRLKPNGEWLPFTAVQAVGVAEPAFVWNARFKLIRVVDSLVGGRGRLEARVLGVFAVAKDAGAATTRAQHLRYLAEIVWAPRAIIDNRHITWQQRGDSEVIGSLSHDGQELILRFHFDSDGDVERVEGSRERDVEGSPTMTPWFGVFSDYRTVQGIRIPTRGEVSWGLDSGPFTYWRGTITAIEAY